MKKKILIIVIASTILTLIIYAAFKTDKISITALGDSIARGMSPFGGESYSYNDYFNEYLENSHKINKYYRNFTEKDIRTNDLINSINDNKYKYYNGKKITIQQALVKADIITISVGTYDLFNHLGITNGGEPAKNNQELNEYFISLFTDLNNLLKLIHKFTTAKIVVIGFYNPQIAPTEKMVNVFEYLDSAYKKVAEKNNCLYISINQEISGNSDYFPNENNIHFSYKAHEWISNEIIKSLKL